jgi:O-antigen biosynthesis protein
MKRLRGTQLYLVPESGIEIIEGQTVATTRQTWLRIEPIAGLTRRKWICLRYSAGFFDEPVRPLIRFDMMDGTTVILPMNGPLLGTAEWIGRVPNGAVSASISPTRRPGPFAFRLEEISSIPRAAMMRHALQQGPDWLYWAIRSRLVNSRREAWQALGFAVGGTPTGAYAQWQARLARPLDLGGFDRPRSGWSDGPLFRLALELKRGDADQLLKTIESVRAQVYSRWRLHVISDAATQTSLLDLFRKHARGDARLLESTPDFAGGDENANAVGESDLVALLNPGDRLSEYALAVVAEEIAPLPNLDLVYADEDWITPHGNLHSPILKPDWSPVLQEQLRYLGRAVFLRARRITAQGFNRLLADQETAVDELARDISPLNIRHIRRVLYSRQGSPMHAGAQTAGAARDDAVDPSEWPQVAVVIATRNQVKLLAECLAGLRDKTDYPSLEIVVVDNGSTQSDAKRLLNRIAAEPGIKVLRRPGPFNFSALSNDGARSTTAPVLVFLNNDVVIIDPGWLKAMVRWAVKPEIGVVGAKLLFANGLIQHAGVVLGFGGIAGHVYRRLPKGHRGYLSQLTVPREVAAVTAACVAVGRSKFEAVGGFDAENLPIDLNDIDFCLRVAERGWTNLWTPEATLIHFQSATRGIDSDPFALYRKERNYFVQRWADVIRDDPYFHPALSLYAHDVALA